MQQRLTVLSAIALPILLLAWTPPARAQDENHADSHLLGSWEVQVTPTTVGVCNGPAIPIPPAFTELVTYDAGGGFQETNSQLNWNVKALFPDFAGSASDGFGTWKRRGLQTRVKFRKLLFDSTGTYIGNVDISEVSEKPEHERFSGTFTIEFKFFNGSPSICGAGTVTGAPIRPEE